MLVPPAIVDALMRDGVGQWPRMHLQQRGSVPVEADVARLWDAALGQPGRGNGKALGSAWRLRKGTSRAHGVPLAPRPVRLSSKRSRVRVSTAAMGQIKTMAMSR